MAVKGRYNSHGCGEMKYEVTQPIGVHPHFQPVCTTGAQFNQAAARKKIDEFCGEFKKMLEKGGTSYGMAYDDVAVWRKGEKDEVPKDQKDSISLRINLERRSKAFCDGPVKDLDQATPFLLKTMKDPEKDECKKRLKTLVSECK